KEISFIDVIKDGWRRENPEIVKDVSFMDTTTRGREKSELVKENIILRKEKSDLIDLNEVSPTNNSNNLRNYRHHHSSRKGEKATDLSKNLSRNDSLLVFDGSKFVLENSIKKEVETLINLDDNLKQETTVKYDETKRFEDLKTIDYTGFLSQELRNAMAEAKIHKQETSKL
ncbi:11702_t:CDS:2, partial [Dentiscutata erythropus]